MSREHKTQNLLPNMTLPNMKSKPCARLAQKCQVTNNLFDERLRTQLRQLQSLHIISIMKKKMRRKIKFIDNH